MQPVRQVAVLIETSREYGRGLIRGVARFHRKKPNWSVYFQQHDLGAPLPSWLKSWQGDGILARVENQESAKDLLALGLPLIDLRGATRALGHPHFGIENQSVAQQAYEHLASCGLKNFAFVGEPAGRYIYDDERRESFSKLVKNHGADCHIFANRSGTRKANSWEEYQQQLAAWLAHLPKPVGIMCCHDDRGQQVLDACQRAELGVPDEVAVIGVDNDEFLCQLSIPSLTSINIGAERIGYQAARLLDRMINGESTFDQSLSFEAAGVIVRQSTDVIACDDPEIAKSLRLIRQNACNFLTVEDILRQIGISQSQFNKRFKKHVGHAPKQEIARVQMETAKHLLTNTHDTIQSIAQQCGFNEAWYFISVFRKENGITPGTFRKKQGKFAEPQVLQSEIALSQERASHVERNQ